MTIERLKNKFSNARAAALKISIETYTEENVSKGIELFAQQRLEQLLDVGIKISADGLDGKAKTLRKLSDLATAAIKVPQYTLLVFDEKLSAHFIASVVKDVAEFAYIVLGGHLNRGDAFLIAIALNSPERGIIMEKPLADSLEFVETIAQICNKKRNFYSPLNIDPRLLNFEGAPVVHLKEKKKNLPAVQKSLMATASTKPPVADKKLMPEVTTKPHELDLDEIDIWILEKLAQLKNQKELKLLAKAGSVYLDLAESFNHKQKLKQLLQEPSDLQRFSDEAAVIQTDFFKNRIVGKKKARSISAGDSPPTLLDSDTESIDSADSDKTIFYTSY